VNRYLRVLTRPHVLPLVLSSILARMPIGVLALALVLFLREHTGSYSAAGAVAGAFALANAFAAPVLGRLIDRLGQPRVLVPATFVHVTALVSLVALGVAGEPAVVLGMLAALAGAALPPVSVALRPLWKGVVGDDDLLTAAYALDAIMVEIVFIVGPTITAVVVAVFSTAAAVAVSAGFMLVGALWFASLEPSRRWQPGGAPTGALGAFASPGVRTLAIAMLPFGFAIGAMEVSLPAFGAAHGSESLPAVLLALQAAGSAVGGLWYGSQGERFGGLVPAYLVLLGAFPVTFALIAAAGSVASMAVIITVSGAVLAPLAVAENHVLQRIAPQASITEAFTWVVTATVLGLAVGNAVAGVVIDASGWRAAMIVGAAVPTAGAIITFMRRHTLHETYAEARI
jgi:MFS family permease